MNRLDLRKRLREQVRNEDGQTMAEYGVVLTVISVGVVLVFGELAGVVAAAIDRVVGLMP
jgi:Flp pilus assembly pilin Flp